MFHLRAGFLYGAGMDTAAVLTRGTVWVALACYVAALAWRSTGHGARMTWLAGCLFFLAHMVAAFHFHHQWSHALAWEDTRQQTHAVTGWNYGGGLYFNYAFAAIWIIDCAAWLWSGRLLSEFNRPWRIALHGFFTFMIFNATVVFGRGWAKPAGLLVCGLAVWLLFRRRQFQS